MESYRSSSALSSQQYLYITFYTSITLIAVTGNSLVILLLYRYKSMRTVTNLFLLNLALGDLLMAVLCVPFSSTSNLLYHSWIFGQLMCRLVSYAQAVSVFLSAYSLIFLSLDRFNAIVYPLKPRCTKKHCHKCIGIIWLISCLTPLPIAVLSKVVPIGTEEGEAEELHYQCIEDWSWFNTSSNATWRQIDFKWCYSFLLMTLQYILPCSVLICTSWRIVGVVWGKQPPGEAHCCRDEKRAASKRKMIKMLLLCVITFALCWLPFNLLLILGDRRPSIYDYEHIELIWFLCHCLAMSHTCFNPIIYIGLNSRFRSGCRHLLSRCCPCLPIDGGTGTGKMNRSTAQYTGGGGGQRSTSYVPHSSSSTTLTKHFIITTAPSAVVVGQRL